jgi:hypothetical protein
MHFSHNILLDYYSAVAFDDAISFMSNKKLWGKFDFFGRFTKIDHCVITNEVHNRLEMTN